MPANNKSEYYLIAALVVVVILGVVGWLASPFDNSGRPLLLLPDVKRVEDYRRQARTWADDLRLLDGRLATLLSGSTGDLLSQSREGQNAFEDSLAIAKATDVAEAPPALAGLRSMIVNTSLSYLEASRSVLLWISAPKQENYDRAVLLVQTARQQLYELEASEWIK
jgi:hypothetical protein